MKRDFRYIYSIIYSVILVSGLVTGYYDILSYVLLAVILYSIVSKFGRGIVLMETIAFFYVFTCLVMPVVGYEVYNYQNHLARIFVKYMVVPEDVYFGYAFPGITGFVLTLTWPVRIGNFSDEGQGLAFHMKKVRWLADRNQRVAIFITLVGVALLSFSFALPASLRFFGDLFFFASFAGILYLYFSTNRSLKMFIIPAFLVILFISSINAAMFTIVVYMGATIISFFFLGSKMGMIQKLALLLGGIFLLLVLQNAKMAFREAGRYGGASGNKFQLFQEKFSDQLNRGGDLIQQDAFFMTFIRLNQGWNISLIMKRIPSQQDFDKGESLGRDLLSALVPRFLWPDKPEAGGRHNMKYYAGLDIVGWSTNVGPLGEAYGAFGVQGGIVYMFLLGLFIRFCYRKVLQISIAIPLLICWIPVLFYQVTYSGETDTLQIMNGFFKTSVFVFLLYKFLPHWFGVIKKKTIWKKRPQTIASINPMDVQTS